MHFGWVFTYFEVYKKSISNATITLGLAVFQGGPKWMVKF